MKFIDNDAVKSLLAKEMNRKEFLMHIGASLLVLVGIGGLVSAFTSPNKNSQFATARRGGYGSSTYGGAKAQS